MLFFSWNKDKFDDVINLTYADMYNCYLYLH